MKNLKKLKKIEIFIGSPRKKGNTSNLAQLLAEQLDSEKTSSEISYLYDYFIKPCVDCRACRRENLECRTIDDMHRLRPRLEKADVLIFGTPIYWFGPSAKTKLFMDRMRPYFLNKKLAGKKAILLLTASSGPKDCDLTIEMFKRMFSELEIDYLGVVAAKGFDVGEVKKDELTIKSIQEIVKKLNC